MSIPISLSDEKQQFLWNVSANPPPQPAVQPGLDKKCSEICHKIELVYDFWPSKGSFFSQNAFFGRKTGLNHLKTGGLG